MLPTCRFQARLLKKVREVLLQFAGTLGAVPSSVSAASRGITSALAGHPLQSLRGLSCSLFLPFETGVIYCPHSTGEETEAYAMGLSSQLQSCPRAAPSAHHPLPSLLEFCAEPQPQALLSWVHLKKASLPLSQAAITRITVCAWGPACSPPSTFRRLLSPENPSGALSRADPQS